MHSYHSLEGFPNPAAQDWYLRGFGPSSTLPGATGWGLAKLRCLFGIEKPLQASYEEVDGDFVPGLAQPIFKYC